MLQLYIKTTVVRRLNVWSFIFKAKVKILAGDIWILKLSIKERKAPRRLQNLAVARVIQAQNLRIDDIFKM